MKQKPKFMESIWGLGISLILCGILIAILGISGIFIEGPKPAIISGGGMIILGIIVTIWGWRNNI